MNFLRPLLEQQNKNITMERIDTHKVMEAKTDTVPVYQALINEIMCELNVRQQTHGLCHPCLAESLNSMALVHLHMLHNPEKALQYHSEAFTILLCAYKNGIENGSMEQHDREHLSKSLAVTYSDIGNVKWALRDFKNAEKAYKQSLELFRTENLPELHPARYSVRHRLKILGQME